MKWKTWEVGSKFSGGFLLRSLVIPVVNTLLPSGFQMCFAVLSILSFLVELSNDFHFKDTFSTALIEYSKQTKQPRLKSSSPAFLQTFRGTASPFGQVPA